MTSPLNREELKQQILNHMVKKYPDSRTDISELSDEENEMMDFFADFADQYAQQVAIEARIDELQDFEWNDAHMYIRKRLAELEKKRKHQE